MCLILLFLVSAAGTPIHEISNSAPLLSNPTTGHANAQYISPQQQQQHQQQQQQQMFFVNSPYSQSVRLPFLLNFNTFCETKLNQR